MSKAAKPRVRVPAGTSEHRPNAAYFQGRSPFLAGWRPALREQYRDIQMAWTDAAARAQEAIQNNGFLTRVLDVECGSVVGSGLRLSSRPDAEAMGWSREETNSWARLVESRHRAWAENPVECDAAGKMTFAKQQQAAYASWKTFGEVTGLLPLITRPASLSKTKVLLLPPVRLMQKNDELNNIIQGVKTDGWGFPLAYFFQEKDKFLGTREREISAFDRDGRPNVLHIFDSSIATNRGISPLAPVLKVTRQVDQFADATLTTAMIQTIFAAFLKTNMTGINAFDGLMTKGDQGALDINAFSAAKGEWYDGAQIDLTQHGRIAQLFPGDELVFSKSNSPSQAYDDFMGWLMREIAAGAGVTYESATGDYRGATYSSIRMAGAIEWQGVKRRRDNIIVPFCQSVYNAWLEEEIFEGRIPFKGGYFAFLANRAAASRANWSGPAQPQADDFKAARAHQVLKDMGATTLMEVEAAYGRDWDDSMRQRSAENELAEELGLPLPWAPTTMLETKEGQDKELEDEGNNDGDGTEKKDAKPRKSSTRGAGRSPSERDPADAKADALETELEASINGD